MDGDIIKNEFFCPRCWLLLMEKKPKSKFIIRNKDRTVRLYCKCGYFEDRIVNIEDFKD